MRAATAPLFHDLIDGLEAHDGIGLGSMIQAMSLHGPLAVHLLALRVRDARGQVAGTVLILFCNGFLYPLAKWIDRRPQKPDHETRTDF